MSHSSQPNPFEFSEADTFREYVTPAIQVAGWGDSPFEISEQPSFTDGLIVLTGHTAKRHKYIRSNFFDITSTTDQIAKSAIYQTVMDICR